jgi:macrolide transport system ATP-binding/permease protein
MPDLSVSEGAAAVWRDVVYAVRQFRRTPVVTIGILLSLGFGIGASATVYSWMASVVLRPLPHVREMDQLITVRPEVRNGFGISWLEYTEWREQASSVSGLAAAAVSLFAVDTRADASTATSTPMYGMFVSANYFDVLGVDAWLGRFFATGDDTEGAPPLAVLSHAAWRSHFNGARDVIGRSIRINGQVVSVAGVAPPNFGGNLAVAQLDVWVPVSTRPLLVPSDRAAWKQRDWRWLDAIGRLRPGTTLEQAHVEFQQIAQRQAQAFQENIGRGARAIPLDIGTASQLKPLFAALLVVTALVVLLICSNVANLLLTRATARERELAVRHSLGASRGRITRQLMTESALLSFVGGGLGVGLAAFGDTYIAQLIPAASVPLSVTSSMDWRFLAVVLGVTGLCVLAAGLAPSLVASRLRPSQTLKDAGSGSARRSRLRSALVVLQFALALSVLVCAAMILRRDRDVRSMDLGFRGGEQVLVAQTEMSLAGYSDPALWRERMERVAERAAAIPGVRRAALGSFVPLGIVGYTRRNVVVPGHPHEPGAADRVLINGVDSGYFNLMGIDVVAGRAFSADDTPSSRAVVVVNQAFAARYFSDRAAIGQSFELGGRTVSVIGVARNGRYDYRDIDNADLPLVYFAWRQMPTGLVTLHLRVDGDPMRYADAVRRTMHEVDPAIVLLPPVTLLENASVPFSISSSALQVLGVLGTAALMLASMGLFSVVSYGVSLRTREIGIRVAVGATRRRIVGLVLRSAATMVLLGFVAGLVCVTVLAAILRSRIPMLASTTLFELVLPSFVLGASALVAGVIPARRAAAIDPARTLRSE